MVVNIHIIKNTKGKQESRTKRKQDHNNTWTFTDIRVKDKRGKKKKRASSDWGPRGPFCTAVNKSFSFDENLQISHICRHSFLPRLTT